MRRIEEVLYLQREFKNGGWGKRGLRRFGSFTPGTPLVQDDGWRCGEFAPRALPDRVIADIARDSKERTYDEQDGYEGGLREIKID